MITRYSKQREALIELIKSTKSHPNADWLYSELRKEFPKISLATVYRNLKQLAEEGIIACIQTDDSAEHYDGDISPHSHFICKKCGSIIDLEVDEDFALDKLISNKYDFDIECHYLTFYGICKKCK